jgi:hypothetical protein
MNVKGIDKVFSDGKIANNARRGGVNLGKNIPPSHF